jgi:N-hydroxyarylamine O-acetyltransferase
MESILDLKAYLERINYGGPLTPTADTLRRLQVAHLLTVPFENLSIHSKEPIVLEDSYLFEKIVARRRGGFCYELNGLFAWLLRALGYDVVMLSGAVADATEGFGPDFDHMTLMVTCNERWLADVGFGDSFREPLPLDERSVQIQGKCAYRIDHNKDYFVLLQRCEGEEWKPQYRFTSRPFQYSDFAEMCLYHQTSTQSHFTRARVCSLATPSGRITLSEMRFIKTGINGERQEQLLEDEAQYAMALRAHFGIVI